MLDGVYIDADKGPEFVSAPPLTDDDVQQIVQTSARRIIRMCTAFGDTRADGVGDLQPLIEIQVKSIPLV